MRVAEQRPGEAAEHIGAREFERGPERGRGNEKERWMVFPEMDGGGAEDRGVERQIGAEEQGDERRRDERNAAVKVYGVRDPVNCAGEIHDPGDAAEPETVPDALSLERDEQRQQGDPGEEMEVERREGSDKENA